MAKQTVGDIKAALDLEIEKQDGVADKAIKLTDRKQAAVKAATLREFSEIVFPVTAE